MRVAFIVKGLRVLTWKVIKSSLAILFICFVFLVVEVKPQVSQLSSLII